MSTITSSPLAQLVQQALQAIGTCDARADALFQPPLPSATIEQLAGGLLVSMGLGEIAEDLDLRAIALLGAASVAGLQAIEMVEPGVHRLESALLALEDLLRRTAPAGAR
jgi:hypothetical protein